MEEMGMFRSGKKGAVQPGGDVDAVTQGGPVHQKPKILAIDIPKACAEALRKAGYNISEGSFGVPYRVPKTGALSVVSCQSAAIPNRDEQEIVIVNTSMPPITDTRPTSVPGPGAPCWWQSCAAGYIDPRPLVMWKCRQSFERIHSHGAIFIVMLTGEVKDQHYWNAPDEVPTERAEHVFSNWGLLMKLEQQVVSVDIEGNELIFGSDWAELSALLKRGSVGASYECAITPVGDLRKNWIPLATNKFGGVVAALLFFEKPRGVVLLLPQMPAIHEVIVELLESFCANWSPALFPDLEGQKWVHRPEYEIPKALSLQSQIEEVKSGADVKIAELQSQINTLREDRADWYTLLRGTGDELVQAVIRTLRSLGFCDVVDMDAEAEAQGQGNNKKEDIQVRDGKPILIVDVKGITGCPDDPESQQAEKHANMRMRELKSTDVKPLTIVNHQKHLPPQDREKHPFRAEIAESAAQTGLGLMTTWDLFKLLRNVEALNWPPEVVKPIFYRSGRIDPIPDHYREIGKIVEIWEPAFGIEPTAAIKIGDILAVETGDTFTEFNIRSLKIKNVAVETAEVGSQCGVGKPDASEKLRKGARVFVMTPAGA